MTDQSTHTQIIHNSAQEAENRAAFLQATLDSVAIGILVIDLNNKISNLNKQFATMWNIPKEILDTKDNNTAIKFVMDQLADPQEFVRRIQEVYKQPELDSHDILHFKDGRVFEDYSRPCKLDGKIIGRVWTFIDITKQEKAKAESEKQMSELTRMNNVMVNRELKMVELKNENDTLHTQLAQLQHTP